MSRAVSTRGYRLLGVLVAGVLARAAAGEDRPKPTFEHTRPKGERQLLPPLPAEHPPVPKPKDAAAKLLNPIDNFILEKLKEHRKGFKPPASDLDFARRASLDLVGVIPTAEDLDRYLKWDAKDRRAKWIDLLLAQQQYADHWSVFWGDLLREQGRIRGTPLNALKRYIHDSLSSNRPLDEWVREMLTATGKSQEKPATAFIIRDNADADTLTVSVTQTFMGIQLRCAQCHDHPYDYWTEKDFSGMAGFWRGTNSRVYKRDELFVRGNKIDRPYMEVVSNPRRADGTFLTGSKSKEGRGPAGLADLITRRDNPYFARAVVNRLWEKMMGVGLVNPTDNLKFDNPASHPELLDWLAVEFVENGHNVKHILRLIASSRTYQQTSTETLTKVRTVSAKPSEAPDVAAGALYDGMLLRPMTAEQVYDSILVATGRYLAESRYFTPSIEVTYPPDPRSFLRALGATDREIVLPRSKTGGIQRSLNMLNGDFINEAVKLHDAHPVRVWRKQRNMMPAQIVDLLFLQILTRPPTPYERNLALQFVGGGVQDGAWEDLQWSLLNCREFHFVR